jgi:serine/threonine protein kinase/tetratricopeptide (TPR) repeat protein
MNVEETASLEEHLASLLLACDRAVAAAMAAPGFSQANSSSEARVDLERDLACIQRLRNVLAPAGATPPANLSAELPFTQLGRFQLQRRLGRGAFGVVFLATDPQLGREVALKVPRPEALLSPELRERFLREARTAAGLDHPNLVPVYEAGEAGAVAYIASAYCAGITLADWLKERTRPVPVRVAVGLAATLAAAVQHAHSRGVVHRDLKPGNILLQLRLDSVQPSPDSTLKCLPDESPSADADLDFIPRITDFGLAKLTSDAPAPAEEGADGQTQSGAVIGTPQYMAPEQASGKNREVGPAADVYALGAILYELLTGRPPFQGETTLDTLEQVRSNEPVSPRRLRPRLQRDLETICLKCLQKELGQRYSSAATLADDLQRFLEGQPIWARPVGSAGRLWRWCRREPVVAILTAALVLAVGGGLSVAVAQWLDVRRERDTAVTAKGKAQTARDIALESLNRLVFQVQDQLRNRPKMHALRRSILRDALEGLKQVADEFEGGGAERSRGIALLNLAEVAQALGQTHEAAQWYDQAHELFQNLAAGDPQDAQARRDLALVYQKLGDVSLRTGDTRAARKYYTLALGLRERGYAADPEDAQTQRDLALAHEKLGSLHLRLGDTKVAREDYTLAHDARQRLLAAAPLDAQAKRELAYSYGQLGDVSHLLGETQAAQDYCARAYKICQELCAADPEDTQAKRDLAVAYLDLGDVKLDQGGRKAAQSAGEYYASALKLFEELRAADPQDARAHRDLAVAYRKLGDVSGYRFETEACRAYYSRARKLFEDIRAADPQDSQALRDLAAIHGQLSNMALDLRKLAEAQAYCEQCLKLSKELNVADPQDAQTQRDLALAYMNLADVKRRTKDIPAARGYAAEALRLFEELRAADPQSVVARLDLSSLCGICGLVEMAAEEFAAAAAWFERGVALLRELDVTGKLIGEPATTKLAYHQQALAECQAAIRVINDMSFALAQPQDKSIQLLTIRAITLARRGRLKDATETILKLRQLAPEDPDAQYSAACCYAQCIPRVAQGKSSFNRAEQNERRKYADWALEALCQAVRHGFKDIEQLKQDPNLEPLRREAAFRKVLGDLEQEIPKENRVK